MNAENDALPRRHRFLSTAATLVPVAFGLLSVALGQDANWDLRNYHLYNAYAWLNQRLDIDLAPAQSQSYVNPLIELPYYWLTLHAPPWFAGFAMGWLHGLNFVLLLAIARSLLAGDPERGRMALWLASVGCTGAAFLSQVGNTMGDNLGALFVLGAFLIVLHTIAAGRSATFLMRLLGGGLVMGLGVGLKLTTAAFALGLGAAIPLAVAAGSPWPLRVRGALAYGFGVALGIAGSIGFWWATMWGTFDSPMFPMFNNIFRSEMALPISTTDTRWLPAGILETAAWPMVFSADPHRVSEIATVQVLWPILYALLVCWGAVALVRVVRGRQTTGWPPAERLLLAFIGASFVAWMTIFSYYRYVVPMELLAPIAVWLLCLRLLPPPRARGIARGCLATIAVVGILGWNSWGHSEWADAAFRVAAPAFDDPARTTIVKVGPEPMGWVVPFFPSPLAFVSLATNFPESDAYVARAHATMAGRGGPVYALLAVPPSWRAEKVARADRIIRRLGLSTLGPVCAAARWAAERSRARVRVQQVDGEGAAAPCELVVAPDQVIDQTAQWRTAVDSAVAALRRYGLRLDRDACSLHPAFIGAGAAPFQLCPVEILPAGAEVASPRHIERP